MSRDPVMVQCDSCGGMTESAHEYTRISYLKTRKWRCPDCYRKWKSGDQSTRGQRFSCQIPRCRTGWLAPDQAYEVIDPITEAVYIVCPTCYGRWEPARDREQARFEAMKESAYKDGFRDGSIQKPISVTVPMNPDAVRNIAATLALIAPDFTAEECTSVAQSFFDMVTPKAVAAMDPGDAGPKAPDGAWGVKSEMVARMQRRLRDAEESGDCDLSLIHGHHGAGKSMFAGIHPTYSDTYARRLKLDDDGPLIPLLGDAYDPITGDVDFTKLRP